MPSRVTAKVQLLDGETQEYTVQPKSHASNLITDVMRYLNVLEADYFGIQYTDKENNLVFLDPNKRIDEQLKNTDKTLSLKFVVRFYPHSPGDLEEFTRYLVALQLKDDIGNNQYKCERNILVYMLATIVQSIYGDHELPECARNDYIADMNILPTNIEDKSQLLSEVRKKHMVLKRMTAAESDSKLLDVACKLDSYGLRFQPCKDKNGADLKLSVSYAGVVIYQGDAKKEFYSWPRIRKLAFKKNKLQLKLKHEQQPTKKGDVMEYVMSSRDVCKNIWRNCIEHYAFFRLDVQPKPKPKPIVFRRGSTFRYSGKTHKQLNELVKNSNFKRQKFERYSVRNKQRRSGDGSGGANSSRHEERSNSGSCGGGEMDEGCFTLGDDEQQQQQQQQENNRPETTQLSKIDEEQKQEGTNDNNNDNNNDETAATPPAAVDKQAQKEEEEEDKTTTATQQQEQEETTTTTNNKSNSKEEDWQVESGDLHSNTAKQQTGGTQQQQQQNNHNNDNNNDCDVADHHCCGANDRRDDVITHSHTNNNHSNSDDDDDVTATEEEEEEAMMTSQVVVVDDTCELIPPPLPPKSRPVTSPSRLTRHHDDPHPADGEEPAYANTAMMMTSSGASGGVMLRHKHSFRANKHHRDSMTSQQQQTRGERCTSFTPSELGVSLLTGEGDDVTTLMTPRTPSQYEMLESRMIEVGLYSAPKKPPIPPSCGDDVITTSAVTAATSCTEQNGDVEGGDVITTMSGDELETSGSGAVVMTTDNNKKVVATETIEPSLLEPIVMKFDDDISTSSSSAASVTSQRDVLVAGDRGSFALDMSMNMTSSMERIIRQHQQRRLHDGDDVINL